MFIFLLWLFSACFSQNLFSCDQQLSKDITQMITQDYSYEKDIEVELISSGHDDFYLVMLDQKKHVLRVHQSNKYWLSSIENYLFELNWLLFLKDCNLAVAYPIVRKDGSLLGLIPTPEGNRYWALYSFSEGANSLTEEQAEIFGRSIAQIHLASNRFKTSYERHHTDIEFLLDDTMDRIEIFLNGTHQEDLFFLQKLSARLKQKIGLISFENDEYGIIGGDFQGYNHHFNEKNAITHFDFELVGYGWRAYDLAVFRWGRGCDDLLWEACLKGYNSIRPLSKREKDAIPIFVIIRKFWLVGSRITVPEGAAWVKDNWDDQIIELKIIFNNV